MILFSCPINQLKVLQQRYLNLMRANIKINDLFVSIKMKKPFFNEDGYFQIVEIYQYFWNTKKVIEFLFNKNIVI